MLSTFFYFSRAFEEHCTWNIKVTVKKKNNNKSAWRVVVFSLNTLVYIYIAVLEKQLVPILCLISNLVF